MVNVFSVMILTLFLQDFRKKEKATAMGALPDSLANQRAELALSEK